MNCLLFHDLDCPDLHALEDIGAVLETVTAEYALISRGTASAVCAARTWMDPAPAVHRV
jgi:hypothetical protein